MAETNKPWPQCSDLVKIELNLTAPTGLSPYEIIHGWPYRVALFKTVWIPDKEQKRLLTI